MAWSAEDEEVRCVLDLRSELGEGLHWHAGSSSLWWVDIHGRWVYRWNLADDEPERMAAPERVGWVFPLDQAPSKVLLGLQGGFTRAAYSRGGLSDFQRLADPFDGNRVLRLNDAKIDSSGAIWAGSLNNEDESRPDGRLFRLDSHGQLTVADGPYCVANGPALSPDERLLLHTDSARRLIYAFDLDVHTGVLSNKRVWREFPLDEGFPDGMTFDADGCVWIAHWGAGCISRFDMDGNLLRRVRMPIPNPTNLCFAGENLGRLFVTSARDGLSEQQLAAAPASGSLFEVDPMKVVGAPAGYSTPD